MKCWIQLCFPAVWLAVVSCNFLEDPKCPPITPLSPDECKGQLSTCWSPGVRDTDCPGHGLCCYDGCANTCHSDHKPSPSIQQPIRKPLPPPIRVNPKPVPIIIPSSNYIPLPPPPPKNEYIPPPAINEYVPPPPARTTPMATTARTPQPPPPLDAKPSHLKGSTTCPPARPLEFNQCTGRLSTCWSVGVPDLDCPNWGLCCFDGCANVCLGSSPPTTVEDLPRYEPDPPRNPCDPNPCGVDSMCIPQEGRPFCKCPEGLVPDPTPKIKCSEPTDPCDPSPCGPGTSCTPNRDGNPICRCLAGLIPKPDTITGCGPECVVDPDCRSGFVCENQRCLERPDPCNPSPCGPGTTCTTNSNGNPVCKCQLGLIPKPDTITGCGPECDIDPDCTLGYICSQQRCVERPDPCQPSPCGKGALSTPSGSSCSCSCPLGTVGDPNKACHRGNCVVDDDCSLDKACQKYNCEDPCLSGTCRATDFCKVVRHQPICGYNYEPPVEETQDTFVIGQRYSPPTPMENGQRLVIGGRYVGGQEERSRDPVVVGGGYQDRVSPAQDPRIMMMMMDTSGLPVIGIGAQRINKVIRRRARKRVGYV